MDHGKQILMIDSDFGATTGSLIAKELSSRGMIVTIVGDPHADGKRLAEVARSMEARQISVPDTFVDVLDWEMNPRRTHKHKRRKKRNH